MKRLSYGAWSRLAGAALMVGAVLSVPGWPAPARAASATAQLNLLGQTPWVEKSGVFRLRLQLPAGLPAGDHLEVQAYTRLTDRTDFDGAVKGNPEGFVWYSTGALEPSALPADPAGGFDVEIPVNQGAPAGSTIPIFNATVGSGVYPIQIGLYNRNGLPDGQPLTTFLVYAAGPPSVTSLPRLSVAVVLPIHASPTVSKKGQVGAPTASEASRLSALASEVNAATGLTVNLDITPQTLDALTVGSLNDQATASALESAVIGGPDAALPSSYVRVSISDMEASGLGGEVGQQLRAGAQTLARAFGTAPSESTWVVNGPIDAATVSRLAEAGATHLIVPDSDLTALPSSVTETTFARPTGLSVPGNPNLIVYGADTQITADFASQEPPVLAANQLLAELAMIQLETPGITRGVVALPPPGWSEAPAFVSTLLSGLRGHPLLASVSVSSLFARVPAAPIVRQLASSPTGSPGTSGSSSSTFSSTTEVSTTPSSTQAPTPSLSGVAGQIQNARRQASATSAILPSNPALAATLQQQVLVSESVDISGGQRQALLGSVAKTSGLIFDQMSLPGSSSITLTSTKAQIPLTILLKRPIKAHVALQLFSQRLLFQPFDPPNGTCTVQTTLAREVCQLVLVSENTTLKIPVQTRSSGVFPLTVSLMSPDGSVVLAHDQDTVRSTAISGVGIVVIVLAVVSLALWWVRDLRRGRRARRLVPAPVDPAADDGLNGTVNLAAPRSGDPVVDDFFTRPPPEYDQPGR